MPARALLLLPIALGLATPTLAQTAQDMEAWTPTATALRANAAGISLPQTVGGLSLTKSGEASNGGRAVDNYAQYLSQDGAVQATFYVYMPTYADASLAAYMTDKAIMERFGDKTRRTAYQSAPVDGLPQRAIRAVYDDAADGALTTAAGFVHAGLAGLDAMLASLQVEDKASLHMTAPAHFAACPASDAGEARLTPAQDGTPALPHNVRIPRDGKDRLCLRGAVETADGRYDILQQTGRRDGAIIVPVDDSGTLLAFDPATPGKGYQLSIHMVGQTDLYGTYDKVPSPRQIAAILDGKDPQTAQAQAIVAYAATGEATMQPGRAGRR